MYLGKTVLLSLLSLYLISPLRGEEIIDMAPFEVRGEETQRLIIPGTAPVTGVLGYEADILEIPRSVTPLTAEQLRDFGVDSMDDLSWLVSGSYGAPVFGLIGVPTIRGDLGEVYQNGQRKAFNRNNFPPSFNSVESITAVKGAAPAVYGYGNATGGYIDIFTKKPLTSQLTEVTLSVGSWDDYRWSIDTTGPINDKWAYRISYEGRDADSFYRFVETRSDSVYGALSYTPNERFRLDLSGEYYDIDFVENPGINRPTQDLINNHRYITGSNYDPNDINTYFGNTFTPTGVVKIDGSEVLLTENDFGHAETYNTQAIATWTPDPDLQIINRTYFESVEATKRSSYYFYSHMPESYTLENRTEVLKDFDTANLQHKLITGAAYRFEYRKTFVDFFDEYFNMFDLTDDPSLITVPVDQIPGLYPVPGTDEYARVGSATLNSTLHNVGLFAQDTIKFNDRWSFIIGTRVDYLNVHNRDPLTAPGVDPNVDTVDHFLFSGSASLIFTPTSSSSYYLTVNRNAAVESSSSSGGFGFTNGEIASEIFENSSELVEFGAKYKLLEDRLFFGSTFFYQRRNRTNPRSGLPDEIELHGIEADIIYQPWDGLYTGLIASWTEAHYIDGPLPGSIATVGEFDPANPSPNYGSFEPGNYRVPGLPKLVGTAFVNYLHPSGFGGSVRLRAQDEQNLDLCGEVKIREQFQLDLGFFYLSDNFEARLDLFNVTDEFNWRATNTPFAGSDLVTRELPFHAKASVTFRF